MPFSRHYSRYVFWMKTRTNCKRQAKKQNIFRNITIKLRISSYGTQTFNDIKNKAFDLRPETKIVACQLENYSCKLNGSFQAVFKRGHSQQNVSRGFLNSWQRIFIPVSERSTARPFQAAICPGGCVSPSHAELRTDRRSGWRAVWRRCMNPGIFATIIPPRPSFRWNSDDESGNYGAPAVNIYGQFVYGVTDVC